MGKHFFLIIIFCLLSAKLTAQSQVIVSGAGTGGVNGTYTYAGTSNSRPNFTYSIYRVEYRYNSIYNVSEWEIWEPTSTTVRYFNSSSSTTPPTAGWAADVAAPPAPSLSLVTATITFNGGSSYIPSAPVPGTNNNPIGRFQLTAGYAGSSLTAITINLNGTYSSISTTKLWSSTDAIFNSGTDVLLSSRTAAASVTFNSFSSAISTSGTYYFITADVNSGATGTITAQVPSQASLTLSTGNISGSFTNSSLSSSSVPLPVEIKSFYTSAQKGKVLLKWETASEINNYGFEIERQTTGNWEKIGFATGNGNSNSTHIYSFIDDNAPSGKLLYRLKQIDNSGEFKYYYAPDVVSDAPSEYNLMQNSPNPFNPTTAIKFQLPANSLVSLIVYDMLGHEVNLLVNEEKPAGSHIVYWNGRDTNGQMVSSGVYLYKLTAGTYTETRKMNLMK